MSVCLDLIKVNVLKILVHIFKDLIKINSYV